VTDAENAVRRTIAEYCHTCDDGRFEEFGECFAEDAVVVLMGKEIVGRDAIKAWIAKGQPAEKRGKHVTFNVLLDVDGDAGRGTGAVDYLFLARSADGPRVSTAGRYLDNYVRTGDRWLFARREITFMAPPA
jgi:ketosteroid isomerase-like protein